MASSIFPVVLAFDCVEDRLSPLNVDVPKPLITVGNRTLLVHQLLLLEQAGFARAMVVTVAPIAAQLQAVLDRAAEVGTLRIAVQMEVVQAEASSCDGDEDDSQSKGGAKPSPSPTAAPATKSGSPAEAAPAKTVDVLKRQLGTADALRLVAAHVPKGVDLLILPADVIAGPPSLLSSLADLHRIRDGAITMLLRQDAKVVLAPGQKPKKKITKDGVTKFFGVVEGEERVVFVRSELDLEDCERSEEDGKLLTIAKALLRRRARIAIRTDIEDMHTYVLSYSVLQTIVEMEDLSSMQDDVLPLLIDRQFRDDDDAKVAEAAAEAEAEKVALAAEAASGAAAASRSPLAAVTRGLVRMDSMASADELGLGADAELPPSGCFALTVRSGSDALDRNARFAIRADSVPMFLAANFEALSRFEVLGVAKRRPDTKVVKNCTIGGEFRSGKKSILRNCVIGSGVKIGAKCTLNNCVVMDNAVIGDACTIQNSIVCAAAQVKKGCNLKNCQVTHHVVVEEGSTLKNEIVSGEADEEDFDDEDAGPALGDLVFG